jgi:phosphotransferase system  glucose/maltose/N-acetylglucosamine-specific IIC component
MRMNKENIPLILMLVAGAITCIFTMIHDYPVWAKLLSLLIVLLVFFLLGSLLRWTLETFEYENAKRAKEEKEKAEQEEGEVVEKNGEEQEDQHTKKA